MKFGWISFQVDEAVAVLQAHQAKEAAQKSVTNSAVVPSVWIQGKAVFSGETIPSEIGAHVSNVLRLCFIFAEQGESAEEKKLEEKGESSIKREIYIYIYIKKYWKEVSGQVYEEL